MEKRLTMLLASLFLAVGMALAQTQVSGCVTSSEDGEPVIGASIKVVGTSTGTVTDVDGKFSLSVSNDAKLQVSYIGMMTKTVKATENMKIVLDPDNKTLDEVMVVAYGTQKKSSFTGSAKVVGSGELAKVQVTNAVDALKGQVAGVQISAASGQPGSGSTVRVRGISSVNAGNDPLIVLDGVPYDGDINTITPSDIENMTVLKDAASTALYGARGANGVIMITTKKGASGKGTITVDAKWGSNSRAVPDYKMVNDPAKYYEMWYGSLKNYAHNTLGFDAAQSHAFAAKNLIDGENYGLGYNVYTLPENQQLIDINGKLNPNATLGRKFAYNGNEYYITPDSWIDASFKHSLRQEYTISATAGNDRGSFYSSVNYLDYQGITMNSDYKRFSGRLKADYKLKDWLKVLGNVSFSHYSQNNTGDDEGKSGSSGNVFAMTKIAPIYPLYVRDAQGNIIFDEVSKLNSYDYGDGSIIGLKRPYLAQANPLSALQLDNHKLVGNMFNGTLGAEVTLPYGFKFTTTNNATVDETRQNETTNPFFGQYASENGMAYVYHIRYFTYDVQQLLNWSHSFGDHTVSAVLGHDYYNRNYSYLYGNKTNQFDISNPELAGAIKVGNTNSYVRDYNTESLFVRALYDYKNKYHGELSVMRQASSKFHPDHQWGTFWSAGASWVISKEKWFDVKWIDELRAKISYGETGNDNISYNLFTNRYDIKSSNGSVSLVPKSVPGNENITWEKNGEWNFGLVGDFFRNRLNVSLDLFSRKTSDMLYALSLPNSYGFTSYYDNVGDMINEGVELDVNGDIIRTKDFTWSANFNMTYIKNHVSKLPEEKKTTVTDGEAGYTSGLFFVSEGNSLYTFRLKKYAGVDHETGQALYYKTITDANGAQTVTTTTKSSEATYYLCGDALSPVYGGFGTSFAYKGFDLSMNFSYQLGGKLYDSDYETLMTGSRGSAFHVDLQNAWTVDNMDSNIPRMQYDDTDHAATSDRFLISASYLSLQNINLGYTLPNNLVKKLGLTKTRIYVTADNVWVWSKRQGLDPRQTMFGDDSNYDSGYGNSSYAPGIRTISGGITLTF